ncbi:hypothetical protein EDB80DRAFT_694949 [Ilyonectria destructans]|nr:hypothetical protein EDB80DRAFT_694949 [Ilyonectria destructans]
MQGSAKRNLVLFKKLCGEDTLQKVALTTTMWDMVNKEEGLQREEELMNTQEFWGWMLSKGSTVHRHYHTRESAMNIITQLASRNKPFATDLQTQLVDQRLTLDRTSVGKVLQSELLTQRQIWEEELRLVQKDIQTALEENDKEAGSVSREERDVYSRLAQKGQHDERVARMESRLRAARENLPKRAASSQAGNSKSGDRKEFSPVSVSMFRFAQNLSKAALEELETEAQVDDTADAAGEDSKGLNDPKPLNLADDLGSVVDPPDVAQFTDSGYASVRRDAGPMSDEKTILTQLAVEPDSTESRNEDTNDTATVYSIAWSVPEDELDTYKSELSEAILKNLRRHVPDVELLESLATVLPSSLKSFALRLGCPGSSKAEKEVMYFVHKHRIDIAHRFNDAARGIPEEDASIRPVEKLEEAVVNRNIGQWLQDVSQDNAMGRDDESRDARPDWNQQLDAPDEIEEQPSLPDKRGYRDAVFNSVAYRWLMTRLIKALVLAPVEGDDLCAHIQSEISACLEQNRSVSSKRASERYTMLFVAEWNPMAFLQEQFLDHSHVRRLLHEVLTLTGSATDAQVLPCAEYVRQTWAATGPALLALLTDALVLEKEVSGELGDKSVVKCLFRKSHLDVQVEGTADAIAEVGEQIGWLGAALRRSCTESGLATCRPKIQTYVPSAGPAICTIRFAMEEISADTKPPAAGQCWHELFQNPVVVRGYPIPRRTQYDSGLEIPLNVMSGLTKCPRINRFLGSHFLKGFSTALVPMKRLSEAILWHLYYSPDGSRLPYPDLDAMDLDHVDTSLKDLTTTRHIVGWCSEAKFYAGAAGMNYAIKPSQLQRPGRDFALEKVSFSVGELVTGGCTFGIGRKDTHVRITRGSYKAKLEWIDQKYVTLWDVIEHRGWLVSGSAALLHLLRTSLESSRVDKFRSEFLFEQDKFEESPNPATLSSAVDVLLNPVNQKLKLYPKDEYTYTETRILPNGQREAITKTVTSQTTLKDRVEELYETLEKLIDHNARVEASYKGVNAKLRLHDQLDGWDFADIATDRDPFYLRKATLPLHKLSWVDFTRAIPAINLFGKGFGDIIRASPMKHDNPAAICRGWETVPTKSHLLCISVSDLRDIIDRIGDQWTNPITLAPGIIWHNPFPESPFHKNCLCSAKGIASQRQIHHPVQELGSSKMRFSMSKHVVDLTNHQNGAVIFGPRPEWKMSWGLSAVSGSSEGESSSRTAIGNSGTSEPSNADNNSSGSLSISTSASPGHQEQGSSRLFSGSGTGSYIGSTSDGSRSSETPNPSFCNPPLNPPSVAGVTGEISSTEGDDSEDLQGAKSERPSRMRTVVTVLKTTFRGRKPK